MKKRVRFNDNEILDIIASYTDRMEKVSSLAKRYAVSRAGIYEVLKRGGVDTAKGGPNVVLFVSCCVCGKVIPKYRSEVRRTKRSFCDQGCVRTFQKHGDGQITIVRKQSLEEARMVISKYFPIRPEHVIHRENGNDFDNDPRNLKVFACQGDHIRYHQGAIVPILWDGAASY